MRRKAPARSALIALSVLTNACNLMIEPAEDKDDEIHVDPPTSGDQGKPLDVFFNGIAFGNNVVSPEKWQGKAPVSTGESDAPVISMSPAAVRVGPGRDKATFPIYFTDITMLDARQAPNRLIVKLRGVDWRWWEYPMNPQEWIDRMPAAYEYGIWLRGDWETLSELGPQVLELAYAEESGKVGEFVPLEVTVGANAAAPYKDLSCGQLAQRLTEEAAAEGHGGDYTCVDDTMICRHTAALDARCGGNGNPELVVARGEGAEALTLEQAPRGVICRSAYQLKPYKYDDMTGVPFNPTSWDETLGSAESMKNCLSVLAEPGTPEDVYTRGQLCCQ